MVKKKQPKQLDVQKFSLRDNSWLGKLGDKRSKLLRKLVLKMKRFNEEEVLLPFNRSIKSVEILYRGNKASWFHDKVDGCKLLIRVENLDEEGIGMHLTETAKVLKWILWAPLLGDPNTSRQAPDRVWRESTFANPAEFLISYVDDSKVDTLEELVSGRWDSGMMLGGAGKVKNLIYKHISDDNEELKKSIQEWLRFLKWHQEFDWEEICENVLFGSNNPKPDIFWESEDYEVPESYISTTLWTPDKPNMADNIRQIVAEIRGFGELKAMLEEEVSIDVEDLEQKDSTLDESINEQSVLSTSGSPAPSSQSPVYSPTGSVFRPDMPYKGANKVAFESYFMRHTLWKNSPVGRKKRPFPFEVTARRKLSKIKSSKPVRLLKKQKSVSRRKVKGKQSKAKRKSKIKSSRKGSQSKNNKKNRRR